MADDSIGQSWPVLGPVAAALGIVAGAATSLATLTKVFEQPFYIRLGTIGALGALTGLSVIAAVASWPKKLNQGTREHRRNVAVALLALRTLVVIVAAVGEVLLLKFAIDFKSVRMTEIQNQGRRGLLLKAPHDPADLSINVWVEQLQHLDVDVEESPRSGLVSFMNVRPNSATVRLDGFGDREEVRIVLDAAPGVAVNKRPVPDKRSVECLTDSQVAAVWPWLWTAGGVVCVAGLAWEWFRSRWLLRVVSLPE